MSCLAMRHFDQLRTIVFSKDELDAAEAEMRAGRVILSSVARGGLTVGLTANKTGTQWFSGYREGFFLGVLATWDAGETFRLDSLQIPPWLLDAAGTPLEAEARQAARDWSVARMLDDRHFAMLGWEGELEALRRRIAAARGRRPAWRPNPTGAIRRSRPATAPAETRRIRKGDRHDNL